MDKMTHGDAGHYEAIISLRPLPQKVRKSKSTRASKAEILTSSRYKNKLEMKSNQHKIKSASEKSLQIMRERERKERL